MMCAKKWAIYILTKDRYLMAMPPITFNKTQRIFENK